MSSGVVYCLILTCAASTGVAQVPANTSSEPLVERAIAVRPSPRQLAWQRREVTGLVHFGMNTFTGQAWGSGKEDPRLFNPTSLDCRQWVKICQSFGAQSLTLSTKHLDGFCLWPSKLTEHSVKNSPWKNGHGDVVRELGDACREAGLKFGVYLCASDLHEASYGTEAYNPFFQGLLRELLTGYGELSELWFDGYESPHKRQVLDWQAVYRLIRELQPYACIVIRGPDARWVGNEAGRARDSEWSVIGLPVPADRFTWTDMTTYDLGSRAALTRSDSLHWYPALVDFSLRPGWFYIPSENKVVHSRQELIDAYLESVGRNAVLQLNISPDPRGLVPEVDASRLAEFGKLIRQNFSTNLLATCTTKATSLAGPNFAAAHALDGNPDTAWNPTPLDRAPELVIETPQSVRFDLIYLREDIRQSQRVESFAVDAWQENEWKEIARATTIGNCRILHVAQTETTKLRVRILSSRSTPYIAEVGVTLWRN